MGGKIKTESVEFVGYLTSVPVGGSGTCGSLTGGEKEPPGSDEKSEPFRAVPVEPQSFSEAAAEKLLSCVVSCIVGECACTFCCCGQKILCVLFVVGQWMFI